MIDQYFKSEREKADVLIFIRGLIYGVNHHSPTANHYYRLIDRLLTGKKLTKKMNENLSWIIKEVRISCGNGKV